jgi:hypothetical protein
MASRRSILLLTAGLFVLNVALNAPFFLPGEGKYRDSIEGGYASMARFISEHPNPFGWNPEQYMGLPTHRWYLPVVPYASAGLIRLLPMLKPEHVYRLAVTAMACAGPVSMFLFVFYFTRRRNWALLTALAYTFYSPSYLVFPAIMKDQGITNLPWRIQVLVKYGEGPHNTGLALLPLALILLWHAATRRRFLHLFAAAAMLACVALTNWVACLGLAWCCLAMLLTGSASSREHGFSAKRLLTASAMGYTLACFWLTPRLIETTIFNWPVDAFQYQVRALQWALFAGLAAIPVCGWLIASRCPRWYYPAFLGVCFTGFLYAAGGHYWFGADVIPESRRYAIELEWFFFVVLFEAVRFLFFQPNRLWRDALMIALGLHLGWYPPQARTYASETWIMHRPTPRQNTIEYRAAEFLNSTGTRGRIYAGGGTRFRLNSWFLLPQLGGTFESGLSNRSALYFHYMIRTGYQSPPGRRAEDAKLLLRAAGVEYVVIHGPKSAEHWKDFVGPSTFEGVLPKVFEEGDDRIYRVPFTGFAHLVKGPEYPQSRVVNANAPDLIGFVAAMDDPQRQLRFEWLSNSRVRIEGSIPPEMLVSTRVAFHPGWEATQDGQPLTTERDAMDLILVRPRAAEWTRIDLRYTPPKQQIAGTLVSVLSWSGCIAAAILERRRRKA